jgi:DegV family protein with EDD domain
MGNFNTAEEPVKALNGKQLYYSFIAGAQRMLANQNHINKINVFPVKDGDTGTNLASTFRSIMDSNIPTSDVKSTADAIAEAALIGARGNSGIIFAQFLYGFSSGIKTNDQELDVPSFSDALKQAVQYSYDAIANPVEGTIITVLREWAEDIEKIKDGYSDFVKLITTSYETAKQSLASTTEKLDVLAKANVVDAGAKAFVLFLEGMLEFFQHRELKQLALSRNSVKVAAIEMEDDHSDITFRYCTEGLVVIDENADYSKTDIRTLLDSYGDSVVIAGSEKKVRFHVHTDRPTDLFVELGQKGIISFQKVDDMVLQQDIVTNKRAKIAIVSDSTCDLPKEFIERHQINVVPLSVHFGDQFYLDNVTIEPSQFYDLIENGPIYPTTAQPTYKEFTNKYEYLASQYDEIIALNMTSGMSGTWSNSSRAAASVAARTGKRIEVIDTHHLAASLGLFVLRAAKLIEAGKSLDEIKEMVESWKKNTDEWVTSTTVKYMVRSGRVTGGKAFITKLLDIKPVIKMNNGKPDLFAKPRNIRKSMDTVHKDLLKSCKGRKIHSYAITHANNMEDAQWYIDRLKELSGKDPEFISNASPVLSTNTGLGTIAVGVMFEN